MQQSVYIEITRPEDITKPYMVTFTRTYYANFPKLKPWTIDRDSWEGIPEKYFSSSFARQIKKQIIRMEAERFTGIAGLHFPVPYKQRK